MFPGVGPGVGIADGIFPGWSFIFWFSAHRSAAKVRHSLQIEQKRNYGK